MTVTYRLRDGRTWTFANVHPTSLAQVAERILDSGWIDVDTHGDCLSRPDESNPIRVGDITAVDIRDL